MMPAGASSTSSEKPFFSQKARSCGHSCSGVFDVTSQRNCPWRSMRTSPLVCTATVGVATGAAVAALAAAGAAAVDALTTPPWVW